MKTLKNMILLIVEKTDTGVSAYSNDYPIFTTRRTIPELIDNAIEAVSLYYEDESIEIKHDNLKFEIARINLL